MLTFFFFLALFGHITKHPYILLELYFFKFWRTSSTTLNISIHIENRRNKGYPSNLTSDGTGILSLPSERMKWWLITWIAHLWKEWRFTVKRGVSSRYDSNIPDVNWLERCIDISIKINRTMENISVFGKEKKCPKLILNLDITKCTETFSYIFFQLFFSRKMISSYYLIHRKEKRDLLTIFQIKKSVHYSKNVTTTLTEFLNTLIIKEYHKITTINEIWFL